MGASLFQVRDESRIKDVVRNGPLSLSLSMKRDTDSIDEVQMMTDHAGKESVKRYAAVQSVTIGRLLEGKAGH